LFHLLRIGRVSGTWGFRWVQMQEDQMHAPMWLP
jgi:hypothetical protein